MEEFANPEGPQVAVLRPATELPQAAPVSSLERAVNDDGGSSLYGADTPWI